MIVGSIVLVVVATGLLVAGLARQSDPMFYGSIVSSGLAAFAVIISARQLAGVQSDEDDDFDLGPAAASESPGRSTADAPRSGATRSSSTRSSSTRSSARGRAAVTVRDHDEGDPPDEPPAQRVAPADAAAVARLDARVRVIDGRPRYHSDGCLHLLGRESEALPVREAVELGFTPCSQCEPDRTLIAEARRR